MMEDFVKFPLAFGPCAVYLLLEKGEVVYAGKSTNVFARVATHYQRMERRYANKVPYLGDKSHIPKIRFDEVWIKRCHRSMLDAEELALIQKHPPAHNVLMKRQPPKVRVELELLKTFQELAKKNEKVKRRKLKPTPIVVERLRSITLPKVKFLDE